MHSSFVSNTEGVFPGLSFADYKAAPGIGQSMLKRFSAEPTPKHYRESLTRPKVSTEAMEFGTILHCAILTPELLSEAYHLQPETYLAYAALKEEKPWDGRAAICKAWKAKHQDRPIIDAEKEARIQPIVDTVMSLPVAGDIIKTGQKEVSFFKRDEETGLLLKCRVDAISTDTDGATHICDLKKVRRGYASPDRFAVQCADLGYAIQCISYLTITGASRFVFVAAEDESPFEAAQYELDADDLCNAFDQWRAMLRRYADACEDGTWPGYDRTVKRLKLPAWAKGKEPRELESVYYD